VLGPYDFVSIVECPDNETIAACRWSWRLAGSIRLLTLAATPVANFIRTLRRETSGVSCRPRGRSDRSGRGGSAMACLG